MNKQKYDLDARVADMVFPDPKMGAYARNRLRGAGVLTLGDLLKQSEADLLDIPNFGAICLATVKAKLATLGLKLREEQPW